MNFFPMTMLAFVTFLTHLLHLITIYLIFLLSSMVYSQSASSRNQKTQMETSVKDCIALAKYTYYFGLVTQSLSFLWQNNRTSYNPLIRILTTFATSSCLILFTKSLTSTNTVTLQELLMLKLTPCYLHCLPVSYFLDLILLL